MKRIILGVMLLGLLCGLPACTGANASIAENQWWTTFLREEVVKVQTIYPDGNEVPRSLVTTKSGKKMIF